LIKTLIKEFSLCFERHFILSLFGLA